MDEAVCETKRVMFPAPLGQCVLREAETQLYGMCGDLTRVHHYLEAMCRAHGKDLYNVEYVGRCMEEFGKEKRRKIDMGMEEYVVFAMEPKPSQQQEDATKNRVERSLEMAYFAGNEFYNCVKTGMLGVELLGNLVWKVQEVLCALRMPLASGETRVSESALLGELGIANVEFVEKSGDAFDYEPAKSGGAAGDTESVGGARVKRVATFNPKLLRR